MVEVETEGRLVVYRIKNRVFPIDIAPRRILSFRKNYGKNDSVA